MTESKQIGNDETPLGTVIREYAPPYLRYFLFGSVCILLARIPDRTPPVILGVAIDGILRANTTYDLPLLPGSLVPGSVVGQFWFTVLLLTGAIILGSVLTWLGGLLITYGNVHSLHDLRTDTYDTVVGLEMAYFDDTTTGEIMSILNNDVNNISAVRDAYTQGISFGAQLVVTFVYMALLNWQLAVVLLAFPIALAVASRVYSNRLEKRYARVRESVGDVNSQLSDSIEGVDAIKANTREEYERARVSEQSRTYLETNWSTIRLRLAFNIVVWGMSSLAFVGLFLFGGYWILGGSLAAFTGSLTAGTLFTFLMYMGSFLQPVQRLATQVIDQFQNANASAKRVVSVLRDTQTIDDSGAELSVSKGVIEYEHVSFRYGEERTLSDISFQLKGGSFVGIVGSTGAGKSTLLKLLFRFYDPDRGRILIDGQDTTRVSARSVRESIGYVSQDPFLFEGSVAENIAYGDIDVTRKEIVEAAKQAGAHEFVTEMQVGYDSQVGERGSNLSGGQRQRVAIARAVLRDPPILVFDEATSHVDNETELRIKQSLNTIASDRTTFAIAHRLSTVRNADQILVLEDGRLVESGTHERLLEQNGTYADLWHIQVGEYSKVDSLSGDVVPDGGSGDGQRSDSA